LDRLSGNQVHYCSEKLLAWTVELRSMTCVVDKPRYRLHEFARERWHVLDEAGHPVYDDAPDGRDKPLVFTDRDAAMEFRDRKNSEITVD